MQPHSPSARRYRPSPWLLAWAALGAPLAWALHIGARYPLVAVACREGTAFVLHVVTACSTVGVLAAGAASLALFVGARRASMREAEAVRLRRLQYLAEFGMGMSLLFLFAIGAELLPTLFVDPCAAVELELEQGRKS